jgi:hypothetical protein
VDAAHDVPSAGIYRASLSALQADNASFLATTLLSGMPPDREGWPLSVTVGICLFRGPLVAADPGADGYRMSALRTVLGIGYPGYPVGHLLVLPVLLKWICRA